MVDNGEEFRAWMAPHVLATRRFCDVIEAVADRHGQLPDAASPAMMELANEAEYRALSSWRNPVMDTHVFGGMTLRAAVDYLRSFAQLFDSDEPPIYAHAVVARAAFESSTASSWLNQPDIGVRERIRRGLCEQIYSAREVDALRIDEKSSERLDMWVGVAGKFGWTAKRGSSKVNGLGRPTVSDGIVQAAGSGEESRVGDLLYSRASAISHVTWFGLQSGLDVAGAALNPASGTGRVPLGTDTARVGAIAYYMIRTARAAASARVSLMRWADDEWDAGLENQIAAEQEIARLTLERL